MSLISCDASQDASYCPATAPEVLPEIIGLLPEGPAWDAASVDGTVQNQFWLSFATVLAYGYARLCAYLPEFHCNSVVESADTWALEYDLANDCDTYGNNLCAKVTTLGGQSCEHFVESARAAGWVVTCESMADTPMPIAGCFEVGCTPMGPKAERAGLVYPESGCFWSGKVTAHPQPAYWDAAKVSQVASSCPVPGSGLGLSCGTVEDMDCFIVGYYECVNVVHEASSPTLNTACSTDDGVLYFGCDAQSFPCQRMEPTDDTGLFRFGYGDAFTWVVTVDMAASFALQQTLGVYDPIAGTEDEPSTSYAGMFQSGCSPLCSDTTDYVACFLDKIKPAHTTLVVNVTPAS